MRTAPDTERTRSDVVRTSTVSGKGPATSTTVSEGSSTTRVWSVWIARATLSATMREEARREREGIVLSVGKQGQR